MRFCDIREREIPLEMIKIIFILDISLKITNLIFQPHLPGANELMLHPMVGHLISLAGGLFVYSGLNKMLVISKTTFLFILFTQNLKDCKSLIG